MEHELRLRNHIRGLLLDYCRAHIAEDYVTFTQDAVQTILSDRIVLVPPEDPNSVTLPLDPVDILLRSSHLPIIPDEKWTAHVDTLSHIRRSMNIGATSPTTSKCWHDIDPYEQMTENSRLVSPVLSRLALKQTPKFGESRITTSPDSLQSSINAYTLVPVNVPDIPIPPLLTLKEILDVQYKIEPSLHREMVTLVRSVHVGIKSTSDQTNSGVSSFLRSDSQTPPVVEGMEVPIFPRSSCLGFADSSSMSSKIPQSTSDLHCLAPPVDVEEEDLTMEHMRVVDGWTVYPQISSPSPTPSLGLEGTSSQAGELLPPSPPAGQEDGPSVLELESLKMGEVQIPRQRKFGHSDDSISRLPQSLASLLPQCHVSLVELGTHQEGHLLLERGGGDDATIASSMVGQPPSKFDAEDRQEYRTNGDDTEADLKAIWSKAGCNEFEIILQDGIDESKVLLFEVPELPPPTMHNPWEQLPKELRSLTSFLGMVKGIRSLNLELSWVPFKYGSKVPTNEEVSRVSGDITDDLPISVGQDPRQGGEVWKLLNELVSPSSSELTSDLAFTEYMHPEDFAIAEILVDNGFRAHQLVLTRNERYRISSVGVNLSGQIATSSIQHSKGLANVDDVPSSDADQSPLGFNLQATRRGPTQPEYLEPGGDEEEFVQSPAKKRRLGDFSPVAGYRSMSPMLSPDILGTTSRSALSLPTAPLSPRRAEHSRSLSPQSGHVLLNKTLHSCDPVPSRYSNTVYNSESFVVDRVTEPFPAPATGRRQELNGFLALRGVHFNEPPAAANTVETVVENTQSPEALRVPRSIVTDVPSDLIDNNTIRIPEADSFPVSRHQYLASLDLLQKHALCRYLSEQPAGIDLIEREFLGGVDLILDQDSAILFLPLSALPSECEGLITGISDISWRYSHILVIFEAFLTSRAFCDGEENLFVTFTFTEPILKSVRKLKRSLMIAEGVGTKAEDCLISWAFAKNVKEAARLARVYGDMGESRDTTGGLLWQERWWLGEREAEDSPLFEFEDECDLAVVAGMNAFAACVILSQMSVDQLLSLSPQERTERFGKLLGAKRVAELNRVLEQSAAALSSTFPALA